jgi:acetyl esterase
MALDPALSTMLDQLATAGGPRMEEQSPAQARAMFAMMKDLMLDGEPVPVASVEDRTIAGPGGDLPLRIYTPEGDGPFGVLVWLHGGGFVIGDLDTADSTCRKLADRARIVVVSVDYRLAPEHRAPAAVDDGWAATEWAAEHAVELGADPGRLAVGGDSAGGNLAALVALRAAEAGAPTLAHQLLVYPVTDLTLSHPSIRENGEGYLLTASAMRWFVDHYLGDDVDPDDPAVSPVFAPIPDATAPALVLTAGFDPLRDEGEAYARLLEQAGVPVKLERFDTMIHGFFALGSLTPVAGEAVDTAAAALRSALTG